MPIRIPDSLPAHAILESENIFEMTEHRAMHQDIRPLNVLIRDAAAAQAVQYAAADPCRVPADRKLYIQACRSEPYGTVLLYL